MGGRVGVATFVTHSRLCCGFAARDLPAYPRACVPACPRACVPPCLRAPVPACLRACVPTPALLRYGNAVVDVLTGKVNPSGKLPVTLPAFDNQVNLTAEQWPGVDKVATYTEGLLVGYRW